MIWVGDFFFFGGGGNFEINGLQKHFEYNAEITRRFIKKNANILI